MITFQLYRSAELLNTFKALDLEHAIELVQEQHGVRLVKSRTDERLAFCWSGSDNEYPYELIELD